MANTNYYKTHVEPYVRAELERIYGVRFVSKVLPLTTGGRHEFDAVAEDGSIVASIKSHSGKTATGRRPAAKYQACVAEMYFLSLVDAPKRVLVLTTKAWHEMFVRYIDGRRHSAVEILLLELPEDVQAEVDKVREAASSEMSLKGESVPEIQSPGVPRVRLRESRSLLEGCREEVLAAAKYIHSLGHSEFTPDEVIRYLRQQKSSYSESTIRTHVVSRMCANAPDNHVTTYADLERVARGRYRLRV